jgi:rare lipoprotein A
MTKRIIIWTLVFAALVYLGLSTTGLARRGTALVVENKALALKVADLEKRLSQYKARVEALESPPAPIVAGVASWYGNREQGRLTASGERFDKAGFTLAHRTLPFGTVVLVENVENGRVAPAIVTDRGPFVDGRIADLSEALALRLGFHGKGLARVRLWRASIPAGA